MIKYLRNVGNALYNDSASWALNADGSGDTTFPTSEDDVVLGAEAGNTVLTVNVASECKGFDSTNFTGTFNINNVALKFNGNVALGASMTFAATGSAIIWLSGEQTIKSNGVVFPCAITRNGVGTTTLLDAFSCGTKTLYNYVGGFNSGGFAITCGLYDFSTTFVRTITLGNSTITCSSLNCANTTNLTLTANTAKFIVNQAATGNMSFSHGTAQFYDLELNGYNDANSVKAFAGDLTCTHSLKLAGRGADKKLWIKSSVPGTVRTITAPSVIVENCDFTDIKGAGDGWPSAVKNLYNSSLKWSSNCRYNGVQR